MKKLIILLLSIFLIKLVIFFFAISLVSCTTTPEKKEVVEETFVAIDLELSKEEIFKQFEKVCWNRDIKSKFPIEFMKLSLCVEHYLYYIKRPTKRERIAKNFDELLKEVEERDCLSAFYQTLSMSRNLDLEILKEKVVKRIQTIYLLEYKPLM